MSDLLTIADRFEIEALRGEFTDALMVRDYDRFASLFTQDGAWRIPYIFAIRWRSALAASKSSWKIQTAIRLSYSSRLDREKASRCRAL